MNNKDKYDSNIDELTKDAILTCIVKINKLPKNKKVGKIRADKIRADKIRADKIRADKIRELEKLTIAIKIENYYLKSNFLKKKEFIYNLIIERNYKNLKDKLDVYYEPHVDTRLDDIWIKKNEIIKLSVAYFNNNQSWYKITDGRGWILMDLSFLKVL